MVLNQERDKCTKQKMGADSETTEGTVMCTRSVFVFGMKRGGKSHIYTIHRPDMCHLLTGDLIPYL